MCVCVWGGVYRAMKKNGYVMGEFDVEKIIVAIFLTATESS